MKSLVALAAAAAVAAVAAPAFAQTLPVLGQPSYNVSAGYTGTNVDGLGLGSITVRAGADFGKYFGLEGEGAFGIVDQHAVIADNNTNLHLEDQYAAYAVVRYPILPSTSLFVRGGFGHTDFRVSPTMEPQFNNGLDSWNFGAGGEYFFDGKNGVRAEYTRVNWQDDGLRDADTFSVSYVHKF